MGWLVSVIGAFLLVFVPLCDSLVKIQQQIRSLARIDRALGESADGLCSNINAAIGLNSALRTLYAACPAATAAGQLPALKLQALLIEEQQDLYLLAAHTAALRLGPEYRPLLTLPVRLFVGPCGLPDVLRCVGPQLFSLKHAASDEPGGVSARSLTCRHVRWTYDDARVTAL